MFPKKSSEGEFWPHLHKSTIKVEERNLLDVL